MKTEYRFIVVGSGPTGAMAAQTLVEAGAEVAMLDVGERDETYAPLIPDLDFNALRQSDENQHRYLLGDDFEGIPWGNTRVGSQLTPPRAFQTRLADVLVPFAAETLFPVESLARGGLGSGWGTGCFLFSSAELEAIGLDEPAMLAAYETVAARIGISGAKDDGAAYCLRELAHCQPAMRLEDSMAGILRSYERRRRGLNAKGVFVGRLGQAVLTQPLGDRQPIQYKDMDFWEDRDKSAYRPWMTIGELEKRPNFSYHRHCLVQKFTETGQGVAVEVLRTDTRERQVFTAGTLVMAPGVLGTARIVLRSFDTGVDTLPFITNPYCYIPCLQWRMLGRQTQDRKSSFGQLVINLDEDRANREVAIAVLFSYRSLLLFKLLKEAPLGFRDARVLMQYLQSAFTIAGVHHPESGSATKFLRRRPSDRSPSGDQLTGSYVLSAGEVRTNARREGKIRSALRQMGCQPLRTIYTPPGGSIHYAGTLPFDDRGKPYSLNRRGLLAGTRRVFVADGSGFRFLPAKGLTLTLMANAHLVAQHALKGE